MKDYIHQFAKSRGLTLTGLANALDYASPTSLFRLMHANVRKKSIQDFLQRMTCCLTLTDQERDALFFAVDSKLEGETYARQNRSVRRFMSVASPETPPLLLLQQDGTPLEKPVRYQVFRKIGENGFAKLGEPVAETRIVDDSARHGMSYTYRVQALSEFGDDLVEGGTSAEVGVTAMDKTAPPVPPKPEVLITDAGVRVYWPHVEAEDLAGYRVYRRASGDGAAKLAGEVNLPYNMYIEKPPPKGRVYYSVSSIDDKEPPNESRRSPEAFDEEY